MYRDMTGIFYTCDNCLHDGKQYFDEPCEDCTTAHCGYEEWMNPPEDEDVEIVDKA